MNLIDVVIIICVLLILGVAIYFGFIKRDGCNSCPAAKKFSGKRLKKIFKKHHSK